MTSTARHDTWSAGEHYERYMGRWSRQIATRYLDWLDAPRDAAWLDLGCGTGALTQTILAGRIAALDRGDRPVGGLRRPCARGHLR